MICANKKIIFLKSGCSTKHYNHSRKRNLLGGVFRGKKRYKSN